MTSQNQSNIGFKKKKIQNANKITIDAKHMNMVKHFKDLQGSLPKKRMQLDELRNQYKEFAKQPMKSLSNEQLQLKYKLNEEITKLKDEILSIENKEEENKYYLNVGSFLFQYYNEIENNMMTSVDDIVSSSIAYSGSASVSQPISSSAQQPTTNILDFFTKLSNLSQQQIDKRTQSPVKETLQDQATLNPLKMNKTEIMDNYLRITDPTYIPIHKQDTSTTDRCSICNLDKKIVINEGYMVCEKCGDLNYIIVDSDKPNYKDPPPEISYFAYKRSNHFNELISQLQGAEMTDIPQEVIDKIMIEIKKERITNMVDVSPTKVRHYLKKLGHSRYYEHITHIICRINGRPPPHIPPEVVEKLKVMFREIQQPFIVARNKITPNRKNFLSYNYILYKFFELLGLDEYMGMLKLLSSRDKLHAQDKIFKLICEQLGWQFIPSV
jgi:hypothetical protein